MQRMFVTSNTRNKGENVNKMRAMLLASILLLPLVCQAFAPIVPKVKKTDGNSYSSNSIDSKSTQVYMSGVNGDSKKSTMNGAVNGDRKIDRHSGYGYSRSLLPGSKRKYMRLQRRLNREQKRRLNQIENDERAKDREEDGYAAMFDKNRSIWKKMMLMPLKLARRIVYPEKPKEPGTLILIRHGESLWNANKTFTGWADPDLSPQGYREAEHAARLLLEGGYEVDVVFTSRLKRAIRSTWIILQEMNEVYLPVFKSWRLNERMYGALTGLSKKQTAEQLGAELVQRWRGSLKSRPPPVRSIDQYWPGRDRRYMDLSFSQIPVTESLLDCMQRTEPIWTDKIIHEITMGRNVMVVAHANTLRGLVKIIDEIGDDEIQEISIPTAIPIIYKFDKKTLKPIKPTADKKTATQIHMSGLFLDKPGILKEALKREQEWISRIPGYNSTMGREERPMTPLERSLTKLNAERELGKWAGQFVDTSLPLEDDGNDGNMGKPIMFVEDEVWEKGIHDVEEGQPFDPDSVQFHEATNGEAVNGEKSDQDENPYPNIISNRPAVTMINGLGGMPIRRDSVVVIIRHGKTEHNKLGLFTGWEDTPLAPDGIEEAKQAGRLLKEHGFEFDVVYTSWLSRAIETAWYIMDEVDCLWLPIIKSWRLNERMYGGLTGLSKHMVAQKYGKDQFKAWRRGYKVRPPPVSSFSPNYPGNDKRYRKYLNDLRISARESLIRSLEMGRPVKSRKLPKTESLKDCMDRTIPYFAYQIVPEAINSGKRVLISSSENAIRGLLMHLCEIPEEHITDLEIPNGLPLIFDVKSKCIKLLDDGTGRDPLEVYNFGKAAKYLFRPCQNEDGSPDEECEIHWMADEVLESTKEITTSPPHVQTIIGDYVGIPKIAPDIKEQDSSHAEESPIFVHHNYMGLPMTDEEINHEKENEEVHLNHYTGFPMSIFSKSKDN